MSRESLRHWLPTTLGIVTSFLILVLGSVFLYEAFWPTPTFRFNRIVVDPIAYRPGDELTYVVHGCKLTDLPVKVDLQFEGIGRTHDEYPVPSFSVSVRQGCGVGVNHTQLPAHMNPGSYVLRDTLTTQVNKLHDIIVVGVSNPFSITTGGA